MRVIARCCAVLGVLLLGIAIREDSAMLGLQAACLIIGGLGVWAS